APPAASFPLRRARLAAADDGARAFAAVLDEVVDPRAAIARLQDDTTLPGPVRAEALRHALLFGHDPARLADEASALLVDPEAPAATVARALRLARAADALSPGDARRLH